MHRHFGFPIVFQSKNSNFRQRYNFSNIRQKACKNFNFKNFNFPLHCPGRNAISPEVFNEFSKTFFSLKEEEGGYRRRQFQVHRRFRFAIATLQLFQHPVTTFPTSQRCKNFNFSLYSVLAEMLYLQKYLTNFQ